MKDDLKTYFLSDDPLASFQQWYEEARKVEENPEAMALATSSKQGQPSVRMVLYKGLHDNALTLYGRESSQKGVQLRENPYGSVVFYWHKTGRQVRLSGPVELMERSQVESYFRGRDLESQVASSISEQSEPISSRAALEQKFQEGLDQARANGFVECPALWTGFLLRPSEIEFFLYREYRLNDRFLFKKSSQTQWSWLRLQP